MLVLMGSSIISTDAVYSSSLLLYGEIGGSGQRVQTCRCKMSKFLGCNFQLGNCKKQYCIIYLKVGLKSSHHAKNL